jgi:hypothetical protein
VRQAFVTDATAAPTMIGRSACHSERQLATRNSCERLNNCFSLARLYARFERRDRVSRKDRNALLTDNGTGVVLGIDEMHRCTGLRLTVGKHRFEHAIPEHALSSEFRKQSRMSVQNPRWERGQRAWAQTLHVSTEKDDVHTRPLLLLIAATTRPLMRPCAQASMMD